MSDTQRQSLAERHIQTFVGFVIVGVVGWVGFSVSDSREAIARMEATIMSLQQQLSDMRLQVRETTADRYSQASADRDLARVLKEVTENRRRIERIEGR
ncbi:MAG: hypothetical protein ISR50_16565 [Alphaproteobacteria bacterium]|nr:hypothetical protein [Alphaproteobacteria bacterium]